MTYQELIDRSVEKMGHPKKYGLDRIDSYEQHHIIPRCMGGNDNGENIVYLTIEEHLMAHILLFRENPGNYRLAQAATLMANKSDVFRDKLVNIVDDENEFHQCVNDIYNAKSVWIESLSKKYIGKNNPNYGNHKLAGENHFNYGLRGEKSPLFGKKHSEETRRKQSEGLQGKPKSKEHKKNLSKALKGRHTGENNPRAHTVICLETKVVFDTLHQAAESTGATYQGISRCCRQKQKTAGGYHWMYYDEYLANKNDNSQLSL